MIRRTASLLLITIPVVALAACQGSDDADSPSAAAPAKWSVHAVAGAPPALATRRAPGTDLLEVPAYSAYLAAPKVAAKDPVQSRMTRKAPGMVASLDARRPVPSFVFAPRGAGNRARSAPRFASADLAALAYLDQYRAVYQLESAAMGTAEVAAVHRAPRDGNIVWLRQKVDGREVFGTRMSFLVDRNQDLVAISGSIHPSVAASWTGRIDSRAALAAAMADVTGAPVTGAALSVVAQDADKRAARLAAAAGSGFHLPQPAQVREVFYPLPGALVPAYSVAVEAAMAGSTTSRAYVYVISAADGRILARNNRTFSEARSYAVWAEGAEAGFRPDDGPHGGGFTPHPTGNPDEPLEVLNSVPSIVAEVEGLNTNPEGAADPWLPDGAVDLSAGNNVKAYADHAEPDGFSEGDLLAEQNGQGVFSYNYDIATGPSDNGAQVSTAITQIFFVTNWLHDWWYGSGFTEEAGNAQFDNFDRGGVAGDPLLAEAQDTKGVERNNANMSTPPDGLSPRMQMYIFDGPFDPIGETTFEITQPPEVAGAYPAVGSDFGVDDVLNASGNLVLVDDTVEAPMGGVVTDGCEPFEGVTGEIAVATRGLCAFELKAQNAEAAGAAALVIINNDSANPDVLPPLGGSDRTIAIPVIGIAFASGGVILEALGAGAVAADLTREGRDRDLDRDGTIDNAIVAHEWGHYLHHRLTLCDATAQCGAMSEGWADFVALHMIVREGDDLHATFGEAAWATNNAYFGIRRVPYSVEFTRNALTFGHLADDAVLPVDQHPMLVFGPNSEVHNGGEVWATALFEAYVALIEDEPGLEFAEAQRRMGDYIVAGMLLAPPQPTFTEQRDAILAAIASTEDERDLLSVANAFARRGLGTGAVSPTLDSIDFIGIEENFDVKGELVVTGTEVVVDEDCDEDGHLDAGERGHLVITVMNGGPLPLSGSTVSAPDGPAEITFPDGGSGEIAQLGPFQASDVEIAIELDAGVEGIQSLTLPVQAANPDSFHPTVEAPLVHRVNFDDAPGTAKVDDVESENTPWVPATDLGEELGWVRASDGANAVWFATDAALPGEQVLASPALTVGDEPFVVEFDHAHVFESSDDGTGTGTIINWDGGVIEVSLDGGETWEDVSVYADPGYGGTLFADGGNPLAGRQAYVFASADLPEPTHVTLDFGTALAGKDVMLRFRLGSDEFTGAPGWQIDNLAFEGITNTPFTALVPDEAACGAKEDDAGADDEGDDGCGCRSSGSSGPLGALLFAAALVPFLRRRRRRP